MKKATIGTSAIGILFLLGLLACGVAFAAETPNALNAVSAASGDTGVIGPFACSTLTVKLWGSTGGSAFGGTVTVYGYSTNAASETATPMHAVVSSPFDGSEFYGISPAPRYLKISYTRSAGTLSADVRCAK